MLRKLTLSSDKQLQSTESYKWKEDLLWTPWLGIARPGDALKEFKSRIVRLS